MTNFNADLSTRSFEYARGAARLVNGGIGGSGARGNWTYLANDGNEWIFK